MPRRILIVDDSVDTARALAILLAAQGHRVHTAHDACSALQLAHSEELDAILLDIGLPDMDGFEVARQVRELPLAAQPLIIAVTGYTRIPNHHRDEHAAIDHYLTKPVQLRDLLQLLQ